MTDTIFGNYKCRLILKNGGFRDYIILHRRVAGFTGAQALMQEFAVLTIYCQHTNSIVGRLFFMIDSVKASSYTVFAVKRSDFFQVVKAWSFLD